VKERHKSKQAARRADQFSIVTETSLRRKLLQKIDG
jgi:hypothetical protein